MINVSKKATTNIDKIVENGKETTNPIEIADALNTFYVNIGKYVEQKMSKGNAPFSTYLSNRNIFNIVLNPCTHEEVSKYITDISSVSKSTGPNIIQNSILRYNIDRLIDTITSILNKSLAESTFPHLLKLASVCPIYKTKRNLVTSQLRKAKQAFYNAFFEENKNNIKETWKGIRNLINVSKKATTNIDKIVGNWNGNY